MRVADLRGRTGTRKPYVTLDIHRPIAGCNSKSFCDRWASAHLDGPDQPAVHPSLLLRRTGLRVRSESPSMGCLAPRQVLARPLELFKVISGFTLSHSVTLTLSVLVTSTSQPTCGVRHCAVGDRCGANNVYPIVRRHLWLVALHSDFIHAWFRKCSKRTQAAASRYGGLARWLQRRGRARQESVVLPSSCCVVVRRSRIYRMA